MGIAGIYSDGGGGGEQKGKQEVSQQTQPTVSVGRSFPHHRLHIASRLHTHSRPPPEDRLLAWVQPPAGDPSGTPCLLARGRREGKLV